MLIATETGSGRYTANSKDGAIVGHIREWTYYRAVNETGVKKFSAVALCGVARMDCESLSSALAYIEGCNEA